MFTKISKALSNFQRLSLQQSLVTRYSYSQKCKFLRSDATSFIDSQQLEKLKSQAQLNHIILSVITGKVNPIKDDEESAEGPYALNQLIYKAVKQAQGFDEKFKEQALKPFAQGIARDQIVFQQKRIQDAQSPQNRKLSFFPTVMITRQIFDSIIKPNKTKMLVTGHYGVSKTMSFMLYQIISDVIIKYRLYAAISGQQVPQHLKSYPKLFYLTLQKSQKLTSAGKKGFNTSQFPILLQMQLLKVVKAQCLESIDRESILDVIQNLFLTAEIRTHLVFDQVNSLYDEFRIYQDWQVQKTKLLNQINQSAPKNKKKSAKKKIIPQDSSKLIDQKTQSNNVNEINSKNEQINQMYKTANQVSDCFLNYSKFFNDTKYLSSINIETYLLHKYRLLQDTHDEIIDIYNYAYWPLFNYKQTWQEIADYLVFQYGQIFTHQFLPNHWHKHASDSIVFRRKLRHYLVEKFKKDCQNLLLTPLQIRKACIQLKKQIQQIREQKDFILIEPKKSDTQTQHLTFLQQRITKVMHQAAWKTRQFILLKISKLLMQQNSQNYIKSYIRALNYLSQRLHPDQKDLIINSLYQESQTDESQNSKQREAKATDYSQQLINKRNWAHHSKIRYYSSQDDKQKNLDQFRIDRNLFKIYKDPIIGQYCLVILLPPIITYRLLIEKFFQMQFRPSEVEQYFLGKNCGHNQMGRLIQKCFLSYLPRAQLSGSFCRIKTFAQNKILNFNQKISQFKDLLPVNKQQKKKSKQQITLAQSDISTQKQKKESNFLLSIKKKAGQIQQTDKFYMLKPISNKENSKLVDFIILYTDRKTLYVNIFDPTTAKKIGSEVVNKFQKFLNSYKQEILQSQQDKWTIGAGYDLDVEISYNVLAPLTYKNILSVKQSFQYPFENKKQENREFLNQFQFTETEKEHQIQVKCKGSDKILYLRMHSFKDVEIQVIDKNADANAMQRIISALIESRKLKNQIGKSEA